MSKILKKSDDESAISVREAGKTNELYKSFIGVRFEPLAVCLANQVTRCQPNLKSSEYSELELALSMMHGLAPQNEHEALLVTQMVAVHNMAMEMSRRALLPDQIVGITSENINRTSKLMNLFLRQTDALQKLRGKGQQRIVVKHVHVAEGGQAIVGNVHHPGGGGHEEKQDTTS